MKDPTLFDNKEILLSLATQGHPKKCQETLDRAMHILNAGQEKESDLGKIVNNYTHLKEFERKKPLNMLQEYEGFFDGKLGLRKIKPVSIELKPGSKPYHGKAFPVPHIHKELFRKEIDSLVELGVLEKDSSSDWAAPSFT